MFIVSVDSELLTRNIGYYDMYRKCQKFLQCRCKCVMIREPGHVNIMPEDTISFVSNRAIYFLN